MRTFFSLSRLGDRFCDRLVVTEDIDDAVADVLDALVDVNGASADNTFSVILGQVDSLSPHFSQFLESYLASNGVDLPETPGLTVLDIDDDDDFTELLEAGRTVIVFVDESLVFCDSGRVFHESGRYVSRTGERVGDLLGDLSLLFNGRVLTLDLEGLSLDRSEASNELRLGP